MNQYCIKISNSNRANKNEITLANKMTVQHMLPGMREDRAADLVHDL
jgi:hypothetical protein